MGGAQSLILAVLFVSFTRLVKGEVEFNFGDADQNTTLDSLDNSTIYSEKERQVGAVIHHAGCIPGKRPDPRSCNHFFLCVQNPLYSFTEYHLRCPPTLVYNPQAFTCVSPLFYNCVITAFPIPPPIPPPIWPPIPPIYPPPIWPPISTPVPTAGPPPTPPTTTTTPATPSVCVERGIVCHAVNSFTWCADKDVQTIAGLCPDGYFCNRNCQLPCLNDIRDC